MKRHLALMRFAVGSSRRRAVRSCSLGVALALVTFAFSAVLFLTEALRREFHLGARGLPDLTVQRLVAGRPGLVPADWAPQIAGIAGVIRVEPRVWGYYFVTALAGNFTVVGVEADAMPDEAERGLVIGEGRCFKSDLRYARRDSGRDADAGLGRVPGPGLGPAHRGWPGRAPGDRSAQGDGLADQRRPAGPALGEPGHRFSGSHGGLDRGVSLRFPRPRARPGQRAVRLESAVSGSATGPRCDRQPDSGARLPGSANLAGLAVRHDRPYGG